jgi:hypothetical protein
MPGPSSPSGKSGYELGVCISGQQIVEQLPGLALRARHHGESEVHDVYRTAFVQIHR